MFKFNKTYFGLTILLFAIEVLIALYVRDRFIRPYAGDVLVVILIYCFLRSFLQLKSVIAAFYVLAFAFAIEIFQSLDIVEKLHLKNSKMASTIIGTSFDWMDILCYTVGIIIVLLAEKICRKSQ